MNSYVDYNKIRWNNISRRKGNPYTIPISHEELISAKDKEIEVSLTVGKNVPLEWFSKVKGKKILGLACGGGQQGPIFAIKGYDTTIMDFSIEQLEKDREVSKRENLNIKTVEADMTKEFPFEDESFDIVFCPVSNAYIEDLENMFKESYRVLKKSGIFMLGFVNPFIYMYDGDEVWESDTDLKLKYTIPFNSKELEKEGKIKINPEFGYEFSHTLEKQIKSQLDIGFVMIDFYESKDSRNRLTKYLNDYIATLCMKL